MAGPPERAHILAPSGVAGFIRPAGGADAIDAMHEDVLTGAGNADDGAGPEHRN